MPTILLSKDPERESLWDGSKISMGRTYPWVCASSCSMGKELPQRPQEGSWLSSSVLIRSGDFCQRAGQITPLSKMVQRGTFPVSCSTPKAIPCTIGGRSKIWPWRETCVDPFLWFSCIETFGIDTLCLAFHPTISQTLFSPTFCPLEYASSCISQIDLRHFCIRILRTESSVQKYHWGWWRHTDICKNVSLVPSQFIYLFFQQKKVLSAFLSSIERRSICGWHCNSFALPTQPNPVQLSAVCSSSWWATYAPWRFVDI